MKLTKNQKHFLKTIKDKNVRKYQKQQFKLQNQFDSVIVFSDNIFKPRNKTIGDFLSQHPLKGILFKEDNPNPENINWNFIPSEISEKEYRLRVEIVKDEKLKGTRYEDCFFKVTIPIGTPIQDSLNAVDEFFKQKTEIGNKIISEEKEKELFLNNQFLQDFLDKCNNLKILQNFKTKCVKYQNYEYATKFRQKVWDILVTLSTEKLIELVQDGTIELIDMSRAIGLQKDKIAEMFPKPEGKRIDMDIFKTLFN